MLKNVYVNRRWISKQDIYILQIFFKGRWQTVAQLWESYYKKWYKIIQRDYSYIDTDYYLFSETIEPDECMCESYDDCRYEVEADVGDAIYRYFCLAYEIRKVWYEEDEVEV